MMWSRMIAVLAMLALLTGCAGLAPQRIFESEAELLGKRGMPTRVWENHDGTRTLEYSTQPMGHSNWMYTIDANGRIVEQFDALSRENLARVRKGMSVGEVQRLLGEHSSAQHFVRSGEEVWAWNVLNEWPGVLAVEFNVHFVEGTVARTSYTYVYPRNGAFFDLGMGWPAHPYWGPSWGPAWAWGAPRGWPHAWGWTRPWGWSRYHYW